VFLLGEYGGRSFRRPGRGVEVPHPIAAGNRLEGRDCQGWRLCHRRGRVARSGEAAFSQVGYSDGLVIGEIAGAVGRHQRRHQVDAEQSALAAVLGRYAYGF